MKLRALKVRSANGGPLIRIGPYLDGETIPCPFCQFRDATAGLPEPSPLFG